MENYELLKKTIMAFIHPDSHAGFSKVFDKFESGKVASVLNGMEQIQIFTGNKNQMLAGAALTGLTLGVLMTLACEEKEMVEVLEGFLDLNKDGLEGLANAVDFNMFRKGKEYGDKH